MENPTLTIPDWGTFAFVRSTDSVSFGEGNWVVVRARSKNLVPSMILSSMEQNDLTALARAQRIIEPYNYSKHIPKPEKTKEPRAPRSAGKKVNNRLAFFNPLAPKV